MLFIYISLSLVKSFIKQIAGEIVYFSMGRKMLMAENAISQWQ